MCSRKRLTFIKDFINNESVCHFMVVQLFKLSTKENKLSWLNFRVTELDIKILYSHGHFVLFNYYQKIKIHDIFFSIFI